MSSSTSVTLRTSFVSWPRSRSRRRRRSNVRYTWAWPMWAASYGVMPHEYMVTTGPGSKSTTACRGVSWRRITVRWPDVRSSDVLEADEARRAVALVPDIQGDEHRCERLDRPRGRQAARVERPEPVDHPDHRHGRRQRGGMVRADEHVGVEPGLEVLERAS